MLAVEAPHFHSVSAESLLEAFRFNGSEAAGSEAPPAPQLSGPDASSGPGDESSASEASWINGIWEAIDSDLASNDRNMDDDPPIETFELALPAAITQHRNTQPVKSLLDYPLNISLKDPREIGKCVACDRIIAMVILHDASPQHHMPRVLDITCVRCWMGVDDSVTLKATVRVPGKGKKKRSHEGHGTKVWCDVCNHHIAHGGMRMECKDSGWHEPDFRTEYICATCVPDFNNCSACGGQGSYRNGKWRPRQMFKGEMRTCVALHRITTLTRKRPKFSSVSYVLPTLRSEMSGFDLEPRFPDGGTIDVIPSSVPPSERVAALAEICCGMVDRMSYTLFPFAEILRRSPQWWDWDTWTKTLLPSRVCLEAFIMGLEVAPTRHSRKYVTLGVVSGETSPPPTGTTPATTKPQRKKTAKLPDHELVTFSSFTWFPFEGHVHQGGALWYDNAHSRAVFQALVVRIEADIIAHNLPPPRYIWKYIDKAMQELDSPDEDLTYGVMVSHIKHAKRIGVDPESLRQEMRLDLYSGGRSPHDSPGRYKWVVLPWADRAKYGNDK